jgi:predicted enzyme related to lactoylglutathione lyase
LFEENDMDAYKTHGAFSWSELMTSDPKAATEFYGALFGWKFETMSGLQGPYQIVKVGDIGVGGIMKTPAQAGQMPTAWGCYVTVDDVDETAKKVSRLGGKLLMPPTDIPTVGRFAVIEDPQGAMLNIITYAPR